MRWNKSITKFLFFKPNDCLIIVVSRRYMKSDIFLNIDSGKDRRLGVKPLHKPMLFCCQLDPKNKFEWNSIWNPKDFIRGNAFEAVTCEMLAIFCGPWCVLRCLALVSVRRCVSDGHVKLCLALPHGGLFSTVSLVIPWKLVTSLHHEFVWIIERGLQLASYFVKYWHSRYMHPTRMYILTNLVLGLKTAVAECPRCQYILERCIKSSLQVQISDVFT